jgi:tetratricopeptide (TPR) repeat protein
LTWGVNHLAYVPVVLRLLWPLLGLLLIWTPLGSRLGRILIERIAPWLPGRKSIAYLVAPVLGVVIFWLLRCKNHFLGDGWLLGELVTDGALFSGYEFIDYHLHARLFGLLRLEGTGQVYGLFAVISTLLGGLYLFLAAWSARSLSHDRGERVLLYALLVFFAPVEMFLGYVECYSVLMLCLLLFLVLTVRHFRDGISLHLPAAAFGLALFFHLDALFLVPLLAALVCFPSEHAPRAFARRLLITAAPVLAALALGGAIYWLSGYDREWFEADFVAGRRLLQPLARWTGPHSLLSLAHWKDLLNLLLLLAPVPLVMLVSVWPALASADLRRGSATDRPGHAVGPRGHATGRQRRACVWALPREILLLLGGTLWLLLLMSLVHMKLGAVRDWDLFAAHSSIFVITAWLVWSHATRGRAGASLVAQVAGTAFFLVLPWFWLNADDARSFQRIRDVIVDQPPAVQAYSYEEIGKYLRARGRIPEAIEAYKTSTDANPHNARVLSVLGALQYNSGERAAALVTFERVLEADSTFALGLETMARLRMERGETREALLLARRLAGHAEETCQAMELHARAAEEAGLVDEAITALTRAYRKYPERIDLMERAGGLALLEGNFVHSERAFRAVLRRQPASVSARAGLVVALWEPLRQAPSARGDPGSQRRMREALQLIEGLIVEGEASDLMRSWRLEMRGALGED